MGINHKVWYLGVLLTRFRRSQVRIVDLSNDRRLVVESAVETAGIYYEQTIKAQT